MAKLIIGYENGDYKVGGFSSNQQILSNLDISGMEIPGSVKKIRRDCELFIEKIDNDPMQFEEIFGHMMSGSMEDAKVCCEKVGLYEEDFERDGGGLLHLVAVAVVATIIRQWPSKAHAPTGENDF